METRVAVIGIIVEDPQNIEVLNNILHEYSQYIIGRMGIPYKERNINIISLAVDAPQDAISTLSGKIGRIKGIIERLCEGFGEEKNGYYAFPTPEKMATLTVDDLAPLRSGFRAKYLVDAAQKIASGEVNLNNPKNLPLDDARAELMKIKGVGPKVADCALLFSHRQDRAFPKDVWIKRAMDTLFGGELPKIAEDYAGIAQQYIFFYARDTKLLTN